MPDDYIYQPKPLPPNTQFGGNSQTDSTAQVNPPDTFPVASALSVPTQFPTNGGDDGSGGGGSVQQYYVVIDGVLYTQNFLASGPPVPVV